MKKMILVLLTITLTTLFAAEMEYNDDVSPKEAYEMLKKGAILVDVRSPHEFLYVGHAAGAVNIPIFSIRIDLPPLKTRMKIAKLELEKGKAIHPQKIYRPMMDENEKFVEEVKKAVKGKLDRTILVICRSGERSAYAADKLARNGFDEVYNVEGGYIFGWRPAGLPGGGE